MGIIPAGTVLVIALMLCSMLIIGCTQSQGSQQPSGSTNLGAATNPAAQPQGAVDITADNRTAYEKNQASIAKVIADGTYARNATYAAPSGNETVEFSIAVKGDIITAASATGNATNNISAKIIGKFNSALPDLVVGKKINELSIPKNVAGSSLTAAAFKQYVDSLATNPPAQG